MPVPGLQAKQSSDANHHTFLPHFQQLLSEMSMGKMEPDYRAPCMGPSRGQASQGERVTETRNREMEIETEREKDR